MFDYQVVLWDVALQQVADIIRRTIRAADLACRVGGEEINLVMPDTSVDVARQIAERIRQQVAGSPVPGVGLLTISIGVACRDYSAVVPEAVLERADENLYKAKQGGRNQVAA